MSKKNLHNFISESQCTHPSGRHHVDTASPSDQSKGYTFICTTCGKRFYLIDEHQMQEILDFIDVDVEFVSNRDNN